MGHNRALAKTGVPQRVILETFSRVLKHPEHHQQLALPLLHQWLYAVLMEQPFTTLDALHPNDLQPHQVRAVLTHALDVDTQPNGQWAIVARSANGQHLLNSLVAYAQCYDDWQYRRFLHTTSPQQFTQFAAQQYF
jgi:hypothetical protein